MRAYALCMDKYAKSFCGKDLPIRMRANALMKANINALLKAKGQTRKDLAQWCRRGESWISKIMKEDRREFPMKYFDRISDFFGIQVYQLLQPGINPLYERRTSTRRHVPDRRMAMTHAALRDPVQANRALMQEVLALDPKDRAALEAQLLELRLARNVGTSTTRLLPAALNSGGAATQSRRGRKA